MAQKQKVTLGRLMRYTLCAGPHPAEGKGTKRRVDKCANIRTSAATASSHFATAGGLSHISGAEGVP
eukprot:3856933-Amphidinium_carterae.1